MIRYCCFPAALNRAFHWLYSPDIKNARRCETIGVYRFICRAIFCTLVAVPVSYGENSKRAFTVRDSIGMTVVVDPEPPGVSVSMSSGRVAMSPDGSEFYVVLRRGDLNSGKNEYRLLLYRVSDAGDLLNHNRPLQPTVLATVDSATNQPGISRARWVGKQKIAYLAQTEDGTVQVQVVDTIDHTVRMLTQYPGSVLGFDMTPRSDDFVFAAEELPDWADRQQHGYAVGNESLFEVARAGASHPIVTHIAYFAGRVGAASVTRIDLPPYDSFAGIVWGQWISPSGRWAVVVRQVKEPPEAWLNEYEPIARDDLVPHNRASAPVLSFFRHQVQVPLQYALVNLEDGSSKALIDAPTGFMYGGYLLQACWLPDESAVVLANTFLPLRPASTAERERRRERPSIVAVTLASGAVHRITELDVITPGHAMSGLISADLEQDNLMRVEMLGNDAKAHIAVFRRSGEEWVRTLSPDVRLPKRRFEVKVIQDLNTPPDLVATDLVSRKSALISNFNPEFNQIELGHATVLHWTDDQGVQWSGGLLLPSDPHAHYPVPLVIQTHGFDQNLFLADGPSASGYAARALAARGIAVLQTGDPVGPLAVPEEAENQVRGYTQAIEILRDRNLVDPERVGLHGWSRTGLYVQYALVFSHLRIAAASVADASEVGEWPYAYFFGMPYPGMLELEHMNGAPPFDGPVECWMRRDPLLHLDRIQAPLRIEAYEAGLAWWETYAVLRRQQRPVEYISIPAGSHALIKAWERLTSQEGTVDWYDFWLNGHEDASPGKLEQYSRWRELRKLQSRRDVQSHDDEQPTSIDAQHACVVIGHP